MSSQVNCSCSPASQPASLLVGGTARDGRRVAQRLSLTCRLWLLSLFRPRAAQPPSALCPLPAFSDAAPRRVYSSTQRSVPGDDTYLHEKCSRPVVVGVGVVGGSETRTQSRGARVRSSRSRGGFFPRQAPSSSDGTRGVAWLRSARRRTIRAASRAPYRRSRSFVSDAGTLAITPEERRDLVEGGAAVRARGGGASN